MDALADLLSGVRAHGALFSRSVMTPPWALRFDHTSPLTLVTMVRGQAWIVPTDSEPLALGSGDTALLRAPGPHAIAHPVDAPTRCTVLDGNLCLGLDGAPLTEETTLGVHTYGDSLDAPDLLLSGSYEVSDDLGSYLFSALPSVMLIPADEYPDPLNAMIETEVACTAPGQQLVLDRLLDLALITKLRTWFSLPGTQPPAWYTAMGDPVVGRALRLMHDRPAHPWTVAELAERCGISRAALARAFTALVGTPPMTYLAEWRVCLAAERLRTTDDTVDTIARRVGYSNSFALSAAFKRVRGTTPTAHRRGHGSQAPKDAREMEPVGVHRA